MNPHQTLFQLGMNSRRFSARQPRTNTHINQASTPVNVTNTPTPTPPIPIIPTVEVPTDLSNTSININTQDVLREIMIGYNNNITAYNDNVRTFLEIIGNNTRNEQDNGTNHLSANITSNQEVPREPTIPQQQETQPDINDLFNTMFSNMFQNQPFSSVNTIRTAHYTTTIPNRANSTVIRPTTEQLINALDNITYRASEQNTSTCPITLEEFREGDIIRRIKHCGHIFSSQSINNWFSRHTRCPVCRYDIREYTTSIASPDISANTTSNQTEQHSPNDLMQDVTNHITNIFDNLLLNADSSNNFIYQLGLVPIVTTYEENNT